MVRTRRSLLRASSGTLATLGLGSMAGCTGVMSGGGGGTVTAASMTWTEARLLGYMGYEVLQAKTDLDVVDEMSLGGSMQCFQAVKSGEIDFYHLYTGGAWATIPPKHEKVFQDPELLYEKAKEKMRDEHGLRYLQRGLFNNTYALALRPKWAEKTGITTLGEFADYVSSGNTDLTVVMGPEFAERSDGWPGMTEAYGFADAASELNIRKVGANLTYQILGKGEAEAGMVFTTNPQIKQYNLAVLEDNKNFFPPYNPAPLANGEAVEEYSQIVDPLNSVMKTLKTEEKIIDLNARVAIEGKEAQTVARNYLKQEGLI